MLSKKGKYYIRYPENIFTIVYLGLNIVMLISVFVLGAICTNAPNDSAIVLEEGVEKERGVLFIDKGILILIAMIISFLIVFAYHDVLMCKWIIAGIAILIPIGITIWGYILCLS